MKLMAKEIPNAVTRKYCQTAVKLMAYLEPLHWTKLILGLLIKWYIHVLKIEKNDVNNNLYYILKQLWTNIQQQFLLLFGTVGIKRLLLPAIVEDIDKRTIIHIEINLITKCYWDNTNTLSLFAFQMFSCLLSIYLTPVFLQQAYSSFQKAVCSW